MHTSVSACLLLLQYWNQSEAESYRETARALRAIGRDVVLWKIKAINNGEISRDILSMMLQSACKSQHLNMNLFVSLD